MPEIISIENVARKIFVIRGQKVMLDGDLAALYHVPTKRLNEQVRRNAQRFPSDFMFQLTQQEYETLRSQFATLKGGRGKHRKYLATQKDIRGVLTEHQRKLEQHDTQIRSVFCARGASAFGGEAIRQLTKPEEKMKRRIGFRIEDPKVKYRVKH
jgi:hypothetical protein